MSIRRPIRPEDEASLQALRESQIPALRGLVPGRVLPGDVMSNIQGFFEQDVDKKLRELKFHSTYRLVIKTPNGTMPIITTYLASSEPDIYKFETVYTQHSMPPLPRRHFTGDQIPPDPRLASKGLRVIDMRWAPGITIIRRDQIEDIDPVRTSQFFSEIEAKIENMQIGKTYRVIFKTIQPIGTVYEVKAIEFTSKLTRIMIDREDETKSYKFENGIHVPPGYFILLQEVESTGGSRRRRSKSSKSRSKHRSISRTSRRNKTRSKSRK